MADEAYRRGQAGGDAMYNAAFEERVSQTTAELECAVHQTVLGGPDVDAPFVRVPRTARAMAHLLAQGTLREALRTSEELRRLPYTRSSFERVGHAVGADSRYDAVGDAWGLVCGIQRRRRLWRSWRARVRDVG